MLHGEINPTNDDLLLSQLQNGSQKSFDVLFDKYWEDALNTAYKRLKDLEAAKDIVQDVFTQIWINHETRIDNFPAYLNIAIRNRVLKFFAKQKPVHPFFDALENVSEKNFQADSPLLWKEFFQSFEYLVNTLPPKRRDIFRLKVQEGLSTKMIASEMGIARKTVQNQLGKAIETLKVSLIRLFTIGILLGYFIS